MISLAAASSVGHSSPGIADEPESGLSLALTLPQQDAVRERLRAAQATAPQYAVIGWLAYLYGFKLTQLLSLRVGHLFDEKHNVRANFDAPIGKGVRRVAVSAEMREALETWILSRKRETTGETFILESREGKNQPLGRCQVYRILHDFLSGICEPRRACAMTFRRTAAWNHYIQCGRDMAATSSWLALSPTKAAELLFRGNPENALALPEAKTVSAEEVQILSLFETENMRLTAANRELTTEIGRLQSEVAALKALLARKSDRTEIAPAPAHVALPTRLTQIPEYAEQKFAGRFVFHNAALSSLKDSPYRSVEKVADLIDLLGDAFYRHYTGAGHWNEIVQPALAQRPVIFKHSAGDTVVGQYAGYRRQHAGRAWTLSHHLCLGNARDPQNCFRLFFDWDPEARQIVILHAGRHLDCSMS